MTLMRNKVWVRLSADIVVMEILMMGFSIWVDIHEALDLIQDRSMEAESHQEGDFQMTQRTWCEVTLMILTTWEMIADFVLEGLREGEQAHRDEHDEIESLALYVMRKTHSNRFTKCLEQMVKEKIVVPG
jgi:hypothetical protein